MKTLRAILLLVSLLSAGAQVQQAPKYYYVEPTRAAQIRKLLDEATKARSIADGAKTDRPMELCERMHIDLVEYEAQNRASAAALLILRTQIEVGAPVEYAYDFELGRFEPPGSPARGGNEKA